MPRVASLFLPQLPIERLRRNERPPSAPPERRTGVLGPVDDDPGECSVPRGGGWRPGARWARSDREDVERRIASMPAHQRPPVRELGRRSEAASHPFLGARQVAVSDESPSASLHHHRPAPAPVEHAPLILVASDGRRQVVAAACPAALALGLAAGMAATQARAIVPGIDARPLDPDADAAVLRRLALHAVVRWTPVAAPAGIDGLLLDLTGASHLHGGEGAFCRRLVAFCRRAGYTARVAVAGTPGAAHAVARFGDADVAVVPPGGEVAALSPLPLEVLRLDAATLATAGRFGLTRVGDLLPMPRGPLARRLGLAAVERLDQALGRAAEPVVSVAPFEAPTAELRMLEPIGTPEQVALVANDLVLALVGRLRERGLGVRAAALTVVRVDGVEQVVTIGTSRPSRDPVHLVRLLSLRLDRIDPGLGIESGRLVAVRAEPLDAQEIGSVCPATGAASADAAVMVDRLAGRVGERGVFRVVPVETTVPERAVARASPAAVPASWPDWRRPAHLLPRPERLEGVVALLPDHPPRRFSWRGRPHRVVAGDGPERIVGDWWRREAERDAVRDYFLVEDDAGGRYWVFRRGDGVLPHSGDLGWWMHGVG